MSLFSKDVCTTCPHTWCCVGYVQREFTSKNLAGERVLGYEAPGCCGCFNKKCLVYESRPVDCISYPYFPCIKDGKFIGLWLDMRCHGLAFLTFEGFVETKELWTRVFAEQKDVWDEAVRYEKICWDVWKTGLSFIPVYFADYEPTRSL
jgi:hypothetical protein